MGHLYHGSARAGREDPYYHHKAKKKQVGIYELLGYGVGVIKLSYDDFCRLEFEEFEAVCASWAEHSEANAQGEWERMRLLATIVIQPHCRKKLTPKKLLPLPWDNKRPDLYETAPPSTRERFDEVRQRLGY